MRELLAVALARHIGKVLTPELAKEIAREAASTPDLSVDPWQFAPEHHDGFTFQCERLLDGGLDLRQQRAAYLYETGDGGPVRTDWARLLRLNYEGHQVIFTARAHISNAIVGSVWLWVGTSIDTGEREVTDDLLYVVPQHRNRLLGLRLVQYAERCIFALGVRRADFHFRLSNGADRMARFLGYTPVSTRVTKTHTGDELAGVPSRHKEGQHGPVA